jgi:outer membrane protein OmpA-like peptidoglycan-associated protein
MRFLLVFLLIASCAEPTIKVLSQRESELKTQGGYESYLALEYLEFARKLNLAKDEKNSEYFSKKGLEIIAGNEAIPENPIKWKADAAQMEEMVMMQKRMEKIITDKQLKFQLPIQLAHLTYLYDCWISRESSIAFRSDELAQCRVRFSKLLDELEQFNDARGKDKQVKVEIVEPQFERFDIMFDLNSDKFNNKANSDLMVVLKRISELSGDYRILLVGNADRLGNELYNQQLAFKRAQVVRNYLIKNGAGSDMIEMRSVGEDFPDILTKDGDQKQLNRTVSIYIMKGAKSFEKYPLPLIENFIYRQGLIEQKNKIGLN